MSHFEEDSSRLPEGMQRIAYDADSERYTFRDHEGNIFMGPRGEDYGVLTPVDSGQPGDRPNAFASESSKPDLRIHVQATPSFQDILPAHLITSPSSAESTSAPPSSGASRFRDALRKTKIPAMQNVVNSVRRSATTRKPSKAKGKGDEDEGLIRES
ncbi:hypothetical protein C8J57DRAFT_1142647 [Mycena rebaudengoi]|nr:hypothetical protein C8J57DRAFT_1142647 [Mycena rebaudengoi]